MEWDSWNFEGVFFNKLKATANMFHPLETIKEVIVSGDIVNGTLFIPMDGKDDWVGLYTTKQKAIERLSLIPFEHEYIIRNVQIADHQAANLKKEE